MAGVLVSCLCLFLVASVVSSVTVVTHPPKISSQCDQSDLLQDEQLTNAIGQFKQQLGPPGCNSPKNRTCQDILHCFPSSSSDYYQIQLANGSSVQVYCNMEGTNCGGEGGWMRVAYVNMTQPGATCPQGLTTRNRSGVTYCGRTASGGCQSTLFLVHGLQFSQVCGHLHGYQNTLPEAFEPYLNNMNITLEEHYVDGVSITYGVSPRQHIWTYAVGRCQGSTVLNNNCPCNSGSTITAPTFVGNDYYCESGKTYGTGSEFYIHDPLWDGLQCGGGEEPCCAHSNMPWFNKALSSSTTDDIELRMCVGNDKTDAYEDIAVEIIELFVR